MQIDPERIARWRERAEEYRVCAEACVSDGARRAYRALAEGADSVADRMERGALKLRPREASALEFPAADAVTANRRGNQQVS